jgi:formylglycine-generating enzyme required for sulfatase activity
VTGFGTAAFASFFNRRLPNETEWLYATIKGAASPQSNLDGPATIIGSNPKNMEGMMNNMMESDWPEDKIIIDQKDQANSKILKTTVETWKEPPPATFFKPNKFGIRALNMGIGEWGLRTLSNISKDKLQDNLFIVVGTLEAHIKEDNSPPAVVSRFPWEGFEEVGFRTVKTAVSED